MKSINFTVDSALLKELGERLIGKPGIALAELVKNSYDADANNVRISLDIARNRIIVSDDGNGMGFNEFRDFWMRIGSTHKSKQKVSKRFGRRLTGSKGIGRLSVQFLARYLELQTVSETDRKIRLRAIVRWDKAVNTGDLTKASVSYVTHSSVSDFPKGTRMVLGRLKQKWTVDQIEVLARQVWALQPPFRRRVDVDPKHAFNLDFISPQKGLMEAFQQQVSGILNLWDAKLVGKNKHGEVTLSLEFRDEEPTNLVYKIKDARLQNGDFEIRIFTLQGRQSFGIRVEDARKYVQEYGGVHVYDAGFHLPYYGDPRNDWLSIEFDHSHRLSRSKLLPDNLQVAEGLTFLPTLSRILGVVNVDTSHEKDLEILVTRDRLQESKAFDDLRFMIRYALDYYATREKQRNIVESEAFKRVESPRVMEVEEILKRYAARIPKNVFSSLTRDLEHTSAKYDNESQANARRLNLMASLATAGITSLAFQHQVKQLFSRLEDIRDSLGTIRLSGSGTKRDLEEARRALDEWLKMARETNSLFSFVADAENTKDRRRFPARELIDSLRSQLKTLARGIPIETSGVDKDLLLPQGTYAEWASIFQNVFINAFNALVDASVKQIDVTSVSLGMDREILVQDTGVGVDLTESESLFQPFQRKIPLSAERMELGYGGTGLGLAITRLLATNLGCIVSFKKPRRNYRTAFSLKWRNLLEK